MQVNDRMIGAFRAVMRVGTTSAAAEVLATSQSSVSRSILQLESAIRLQLFERAAGRLIPTGEAKALYEEVEKNYTQQERLKRFMRELHMKQSGRVGVVCPPSLSIGFIAEASVRFLADNDGCNITSETQLSVMIADLMSAQNFDFGFAVYPHTAPGVEISEFSRTTNYCILPIGHRLSTADCVYPRDLNGENFIAMRSDNPTRHRIDQTFADCGATPKIVVETPRAETICEMVARGVGTSIVSPFAALRYAERGLIVIRKYSEDYPSTITLLRPTHRSSGKLQESYLQIVQDLRDEYSERVERMTGLLPTGKL